MPSRKNAPKRTGKRLAPPEDKEDLAKQSGKLTTIVTKQGEGSLQADNPPKPKVVGDRMEVFYLKPYFQKSAKGDLSVSLAFSIALEKEHKELLPKIVADAYHDVLKKGRKSMTLRAVPGSARRDLHLARCERARAFPSCGEGHERDAGADRTQG